MRIIGLTGGIGSGKSTVTGFLAEQGAVIVELDKLGHEVLERKEVRERLIEEFGKDILTGGGDIDRAGLGRLVFNNSELLARLNRITHPFIDDMVNEKIEEFRRNGVGVAVLAAAALLEAGRAWQADELWITVAPEEAVLKRLAGRTGYSGEESKARINSQMSNEERVKQADVVIDTDCTLDELKERVGMEWGKLLERL